MSINTVFVTGATGTQGGWAARHLAQNGIKVLALVRNPESANANNLNHPNIQIVKGDLDNPESYREYIKQTDGVFSVQAMHKKVEQETVQGIALIEEAKKAGIKHFVYSSVFGTEMNTGIPHFDTKLKIENHLRQSGLSFTVLRPVSFYENFLIPQIRKGILKGKIVHLVTENTAQQYIGCEDIGKAVVKIFQDPENFRGKFIPIAAEEFRGKELTETFSRALNKPMKYEKLPNLIIRIFIGKNILKMYQWMEKNYQPDSSYITGTKKLFGEPEKLEAWVKKNFT